MRIQKCWFCSSNIYPGHGVTFVRNDSNVFRFCRSKCHKLFAMRRNPRKTEWTRICRHVKGKELANDHVHVFEKKMKTPLIYNRELVEQTVDAMPRILMLRKKREGAFIKNRILASREESKARDMKHIETYKRLLEQPDASVKALESKLIKTQMIKKKEKDVEYN